MLPEHTEREGHIIADQNDNPQWELGRRCGIGGMSAVYLVELCENTTPSMALGTGLFVAKVLDPEIVNNEKEWPLIEQEFETARTITLDLDTEHFVKTFGLIDLCSNDEWKTNVIIQQRCQCSLKKYIEDPDSPRFQKDEALDLIRGIMTGLCKMHEHRHGWVHGDLKPNNIMLWSKSNPSEGQKPRMRQMTPKLADFGVTRRIADPVAPLDYEKWQAPELFDENKQPITRPASPATDVFAMGKIILHVLNHCDEALPTLEALANQMITGFDERPQRIDQGLIQQISVDYSLIESIQGAGYDPSKHKEELIGRKQILNSLDIAIEKVIAKNSQQGLYWLLIGPPGVGKSAILHHRAKSDQQPLGHPAWFFVSYQKSEAGDLLTQLIDMICKRYPEQTKDVKKSEPGDSRLSEFREVISKAGKFEFDRGKCLQILIDAIDESGNPYEVVTKALPEVLPRGVLILISTRPWSEETEDDYVTTLQKRCCESVTLDPDSRDNRNDLLSYFKKKHQVLKDSSKAKLLEELVTACGGLFLIAEVIQEVLFENGLSPGNQATVLLRKLDFDDLEGTREILEMGADPDGMGIWGKTPLHQAIMRGRSLETIKLILGYGADPGIARKDGTKTMDLARKTGNEELISMLEKASR